MSCQHWLLSVTAAALFAAPAWAGDERKEAAKQRYEAAKERCEQFEGDRQDACEERAKAEYKREKDMIKSEHRGMGGAGDPAGGPVR